jgi:phenylacetate-coenzyme A ligase PaaK-like adenylate-forming protein
MPKASWSSRPWAACTALSSATAPATAFASILVPVPAADPGCAGGILGRTDDMLLVGGNNIYPSMIETVVRAFSQIDEFQIVLDGRRPGKILLRLELRPGSSVESLRDAVITAFRDSHHFRPDVECVAPGTLPRSEMKSRRVVRIM